MHIGAKMCLDTPANRFGCSPGFVAFEDDPVGVGRFFAMKVQGVVLGVYLASPQRLRLSLVGGIGLNIYYENPW